MTWLSLSKVVTLEELHLLKYSLLPGEDITFVPNTDDAAWWETTLDAYSRDANVLPAAPLSAPRFELKIDHAPVRFQIELPPSYGGELDDGTPDVTRPLVSVRGDSISRSEQERWQVLVNETIDELQNSEYIVYELISAHLLPQLHAAYDNAASGSCSPRSTEPKLPQQPRSERYHALLTSHHLISPNKRRSLQQWSASLSLTGFAKVGHPGVIYCEGAQEQVEEFVANVKAMQWLALRVRFVEPAPGDSKQAPSDEPRDRPWVELEKVGEVMEEMRRLGRENYVTEMGIGSARANSPRSSK
ncbi:hypothetical protein CERSUDRAFT_68618 [Gelatoporia subvermispora B]|uniref:Small nuclear ribonucleoprotein Prp3 C-terminal domain-containing protein n=1 Tax=Ceriporiopsis subvermispora (strain B) TaxID=914234 RepID=M2QKE8_CERS8|nr:hypothetical protein CERSUDRAFT_68618 [Gelatoporia subvermispora B]